MMNKKLKAKLDEELAMMVLAGESTSCYTERFIKNHTTTSMYNAIKDNKIGIARIILKAGLDISSMKDRLLQWSTINGYADITKYAVEAGANIHTFNDNPLRMASQRGHTEVMKILIKAGANIHVYDECVAYWITYDNNREEVIKLLVDAGVDPKVLQKPRFEGVPKITRIYE